MAVLDLKRKLATQSCIASVFGHKFVSKNGAIQDFTGVQIHCACQHFQSLQHVHVVFVFFSLPSSSSSSSSSGNKNGKNGRGQAIFGFLS